MRTKIRFFLVSCSIFLMQNTFSQTTQATNAVSNANSYLGTSNNYDVVFKRMGVEAGKLTTNSVSFGVGAKATNNSVSIGLNAGQFSDSWGQNLYIGNNAGRGYNNTNLKNIGSNNTFIGEESGSFNYNGNSNIFIGSESGIGNFSGSSNVFIGEQAGGNNYNGNNNTYIGSSAGIEAVGSNNILIGFNAGAYTQGDNKLFIENSYSENPLIWGDFAEDKLKFNVGSTATSGLEINGPTGQSGLKLSNLNSTSPAVASNGKVLTLDSTGTVILAQATAGSGGTTASNVYTIGLAGGSLPLIGATATASNASGNYLDDVINNAISLGYKKIYIQEGVYKVNNSINIIGKNGITIEGSGMETILLPSASMDADTPMVNVTNDSYNNFVKNLSFQPHDVDAGKIVNTCIRLGAQCDRNTFENIYIGRKSSQNNFTYSTKPIFIDLPKGEADFNTFQNINFYRCIGGIYIKATGGVFNSNTFQNISLHKSKVGVEFEGNGANDNVFSQIKFQTTVNNDGLNAADMTTHVFKNVNGSNNTIRDVFIADWDKDINSNLQYVINTVGPVTPATPATGAYRTIIENVETEANGYNGKPFTFTDYYQDLGTSTQFLNNAMGNRNTDYLMNNVNNVSYLGQEQNSYLNNFNVEKMDRTYFSGRSNESSFFAIEKFNNVFLGSNNVSSGAATTNTYLRGSNVYVNLGTVSPTPGQVLTSSDNGGKLQWTTLPANNNIYSNNGWLNSDRTISMQNAGVNNNLRFNRSDLQTNMASGASDVMFLHSARQAVAIGPNGLNNINARGTNYRLIVNGRAVVRDECLVTGTGWADYVFAKDYKLTPLEEVEKFINKNGHLPNVPSEKTIVEEGLPLAEMTKIQQEKIEELTLYIIEQNKKIKELENLKNEIETLKELFKTIKSE